MKYQEQSSLDFCSLVETLERNLEWFRAREGRGAITPQLRSIGRDIASAVVGIKSLVAEIERLEAEQQTLLNRIRAVNEYAAQLEENLLRVS